MKRTERGDRAERRIRQQDTKKSKGLKRPLDGWQNKRFALFKTWLSLTATVSSDSGQWFLFALSQGEEKEKQTRRDNKNEFVIDEKRNCFRACAWFSTRFHYCCREVGVLWIEGVGGERERETKTQTPKKVLSQSWRNCRLDRCCTAMGSNGERRTRRETETDRQTETQRREQTYKDMKESTKSNWQ